MNAFRLLRKAWRHLAERRLENDSFYRGSARSTVDAVFVIGCGRSGTTLLRAMLERHPQLWGGPESWLFIQRVDPQIYAQKFDTTVDEAKLHLRNSRTAVEFAERYFGLCASRAGKRRWVEKTPKHIHVLPYLMCSFPNAKFIHVVRDGRDVACSLRNHPKAAITRRGSVPIRSNNVISLCISRWVRDTSAGLAYRDHPRLMTIRYERLATSPEESLREVCCFLDEEFVPAMLVANPNQQELKSRKSPSNSSSFEEITTNSLGRWRKDLSHEELLTCLRVGGPLLETLGYLTDATTAVPSEP